MKVYILIQELYLGEGIIDYNVMGAYSCSSNAYKAKAELMACNDLLRDSAFFIVETVMDKGTNLYTYFTEMYKRDQA